MTESEFEELIRRLEANTGKIWEERNEVINVWYKQFERRDYFLMSKAVNLLIETHDRKQFPLMSDMITAIDATRRNMPEQRELRQAECEICNGCGLELILAKDSPQGVRRPCSCRLGRQYDISFSPHKREER